MIIKNSLPESKNYLKDVNVFSQKEKFDVLKSYSLTYDDNLDIDIFLKSN